jgi:hypothetical protein
MKWPKEIDILSQQDALNNLKFSKQMYEINHFLKQGSIKLLLPKDQ